MYYVQWQSRENGWTETGVDRHDTIESALIQARRVVLDGDTADGAGVFSVADGGRVSLVAVVRRDGSVVRLPAPVLV